MAEVSCYTKGIIEKIANGYLLRNILKYFKVYKDKDESRLIVGINTFMTVMLITVQLTYIRQIIKKSQEYGLPVLTYL